MHALHSTRVADTICSPTDSTYLDHAGTTLPCKSLLASFSADILSNLYGNPHSTGSPSSQLASQRIDHVRLRVLQLFNADPAAFDVVFVANATAGIKLVAEALSNAGDGNGNRGFWFGYHRDAHTSLVGVRELARKGSRCFWADSEVEAWINRGEDDMTDEGEDAPKLFAYPAQSNMNGRRLPLAWCGHMRRVHGQGAMTYSLLDAAALVSTSPLDLSDVANAPDFTVLSFYKIFGFPDLGALVVRKQSSHIFRKRKYFGGGTVEAVSCVSEQWHFKKEGSLHEALEDGTLPIHNIIALDSAITVHERLFGTFQHVSAHTTFLTRLLYNNLKEARHSNGRSICEVYEEDSALHSSRWYRGPITAFNFLDDQGQWISNHEVQKLAIVKNIHLRAGNLCNPGGISHALDMQPEILMDNYVAGLRCASERDVLGGRPTGVIRVSLGAMSTLKDVQNFLNFVDEFFVDRTAIPTPMPLPSSDQHKYTIDSLVVYPIKSCGGWRVPANMPWAIRSEGLAWDREWCLVHQGTRSALSQKKYPQMALFKPSFDFSTLHLKIHWIGAQDSDGVSSEISVPLALEPRFFRNSITTSDSLNCQTSVCGDNIQPLIYASCAITAFFSTHLQVPVFLARLPSLTTTSSPPLNTRFVKAKSYPHFEPQHPSSLPTLSIDVPGAFPTPPPSPPPPRRLLLANESPLLVIFLSSLDALNATICANGGEEVPADVFRANIILNDRHPSQSRPISPSPPSRLPPSVPSTVAFPEDYLSQLVISQPVSSNDYTFNSSIPAASSQFPPGNVSLSLLAPCRRCQMVCIDQDTGDRRQEPFSTLAKIRRWGGGVWFGMHAALDEVEEQGHVHVSETEEVSMEKGEGEEETSRAEATIRVGDWVEGS